MDINEEGTQHPFTKLKAGMRVVMRGPINYVTGGGTLLAKHNGSKTLTVLYDGDEEPVSGIPFAAYIGTPTQNPLDQIHPMLAKDISKRKKLTVDDVIQSEGWVCEEKFDGERQILTYVPLSVKTSFKMEDPDEWVVSDEAWFRSNTRVVGKNTGRLSTNSQSLPQLANLSIPTDGATVLDVELMHADGFQTLRSIMGSLPERARGLQAEKGKVYAVVFDILWWNGIDMRELSFSVRRRCLETFFIAHRNPYLKLSPIATIAEEKIAMLDEILARGGEGAMVKHIHGKYTDTTRSGRRSSEILKIKPFKEEDVIIYGFERGKGEYNQSKYGAIKFAQLVRGKDLTDDMVKNTIKFERDSVLHHLEGNAAVEAGEPTYLVHMGTCSGITDEQEAEFRKSPQDFIGKAMEIRYQARWPSTGLFRHPTFIRMREDKDASQCVYS